MTNLSKRIYVILSVIFLILFDVFCSNVVMQNVDKYKPNAILDLIYVQNTGAAFSILQGSKLFLILFSSFAFLWIVYYVLKNIDIISKTSLFWVSLLSAGIFCNLYERVAYGYVRDFFKLNFVNFPVFNISDIFINISVLAIVIIIIKHNFSKNNENSSR